MRILRGGYNHHLFYVTALLLMVASCKTSEKVTTTPEQFASLYNPSEYSLNVDYSFYHISNDLTSMYIRLFPGEILFNQANEDAEYRAVVEVEYSLYELDDQGVAVAVSDSSKFLIKLKPVDQERSAVFISKVLQIPAGKRFLIRLYAKDMQRGSVGLKHLFIDKANDYSAQNYSILSGTTGYPKFLNYLSDGELFRIGYRIPGHDTMYIDYYKPVNFPPRPPVTLDSPSSFPFVADTTYVVEYSDTLLFTLPEVGMYHIRVDSVVKEGITIHNFGPDYPQIKSEEGLLGPLYYISTMAEFNQLRYSDDLKTAIDEFWLNRTSSPERSRELIRIYYNRVLYSNLYFTAEREGWKTDRGMMFILFGPPDRMKDSGNEQRWYYISRRQGRVLEFVFERKYSRFSNQDLVWKKDIQSMQYWNAAVSSWRSGKVYSLGK